MHKWFRDMETCQGILTLLLEWILGLPWETGSNRLWGSHLELATLVTISVKISSVSSWVEACRVSRGCRKHDITSSFLAFGSRDSMGAQQKSFTTHQALYN